MHRHADNALAQPNGRNGQMAIVIAVLAMTAGCTKQPASASYFPLADGTEWVYEVSTTSDGETKRNVQTIRALGEQTYEGEKVAVRRSEMQDGIGIEYLLRVGQSDIMRIGQRTDLDEVAIPDETPRVVMKLPLRAGASWSAPTVPFTVLRSHERPRELKYGKPVLMTYTVEAMDEKVEVPAGSFTGCARVRGEAFLTLFIDPVKGFTKVPVTNTEWYCPGVGMVKLERVEKLSTSFYTGGSVSMTLANFRAP